MCSPVETRVCSNVCLSDSCDDADLIYCWRKYRWRSESSGSDSCEWVTSEDGREKFLRMGDNNGAKSSDAFLHLVPCGSTKFPEL